MAGAYRQLLREIPAEKGWFWTGIPHEEYLVEALAARKEEDYITKISHKSAGKKKRPLNRNGWRPFFLSARRTGIGL